MKHATIATICLTSVILILLGCGGGNQSSKSQSPTPVLPVSGLIESASVINSASTPFGGDAVAGSLTTNGTGPALALTNGSDNIQGIRGGSILITFTSQLPLSSMLLGVSGMSSYYKIDLTTSKAVRSASEPSGNYWLYEPKTHLHVHVRKNVAKASAQSSSYDYILSAVLPPNLQAPSLSLLLVAEYTSSSSQATGGSSSVSPPSPVTVNIIQSAASSSSFQASLTWRAPVDIDLHCTPPGGSEIGFDNRSNSGGTLDTDSNPGCSIDNKDQENITWATGTAPVGVYRLRPDYYAACQPGSVSYQLTIRTPQTATAEEYDDAFSDSEADGNSSPTTDTSHVVYCCVLPPVSSDSGLISELTLAEIGNPSSRGSQFNIGDATTAAQAIRSIVENRKRKPSAFSAANATTPGIIFATNQFAGFNANGTINPTITDRVEGDLFPNSQPANTWIDFWNAVLTASTETYSEATNDPFVTITKVGTQTLIGGTWGVRTQGSSSPGGNFVLVGTADGQDFYGLKPGVVPQ